jgi:hypothetical protein
MRMRSAPHLFLEDELPARRRPWLPVVGSVLAHALILLVLVGLTHEKVPTQPATSSAPERKVEMATLPPLPAPAPRPKAAPRPVPEPAPTPPPPQMPRPQVKRGERLPEEVLVAPTPPPETGPLGAPPEARAPEPSTAAESPSRRATEPVTPAKAGASTELSMVEEAKRLFGPKQTGVTGGGPQPRARWAEEMTDDRDNDCTPRLRTVRDTAAPVTMGVVSGRVYREGTSQPLSGAFLQILGTSYSTYADDNGWYSLSFDQSLVDECRTQYVQVSKDGFRPRRLILGLGARADNDIRMRRW